MRWAKPDFGASTRWRRWFAWHPVTIDGVRVWLEFIERRTVYWYGGWYSAYRFPECVE